MWLDRENKMYLHMLVGESLADMFAHNFDGIHGMQMARFKVGSSTIVVLRRLTDVKVTIYEDLK